MYELGNANQKLPFLFSPFGGGVGGGAVQRNGRKFFGLPARVRERGRGAFPRHRSRPKNLKPPPPPRPPRRKAKRGKEFFGLRCRKKTPQGAKKARRGKANEAPCSVSLRQPEAQCNAVCARAQANLCVLAPPAQCAHKPAR